MNSYSTDTGLGNTYNTPRRASDDRRLGIGALGASATLLGQPERGVGHCLVTCAEWDKFTCKRT